jgi:NAD(P)-dependent dehydrogenase (short-subunit alcohol dehydrogenase family)
VAPSLRPLDQQVIVITGASSGIGLVTARAAARGGAKVVLAARNGDALEEVVEKIRADGGTATHVVADVGREEDVQHVADVAIETYGRFDTWVNNAGVSIFGDIVDVSVEDFRRVFDTVFWGVVYGSRIAVAHYRDRPENLGRGALINVGSFFGDRATPVQSTYGSAKFAVHGFTEALRVETAHAGIPVSVTLVHPGRIDTPYNEHAHSYIDQQPAHRGMIYPPEAVAEAILYAAAHPKRDLYVGAQAKLLLVASNVAPRVLDLVMRRYQYWSQHADRPSRPREQSALYKAGYGGQERGTHEGHVRRRSLYVDASTRPALSAVAVVALAGAFLGRRGLSRSRRRSG